MSTELRDLIAASQAAFKADPEKAKAVFSSKSALQEGLRSEAAMREHTLTVDEPESLGGKDAGPNPVELVLAALGTCQEITYRAYATALGIPLDAVSVELDGEIDLRGFPRGRRHGPARLPGHHRHGHAQVIGQRSGASDPARRGQRPLPGARHPAQPGAGRAQARHRRGVGWRGRIGLLVGPDREFVAVGIGEVKAPAAGELEDRLDDPRRRRPRRGLGCRRGRWRRG